MPGRRRRASHRFSGLFTETPSHAVKAPLLDTRSNGLTYASARMRGSPLCAQLTMLPDECQRSPLALDAAVRM